MIRGLMSDEEWTCLEPFVIERRARSGRRPRDHRLVLDGIFWIARTGVARRDLHEHFGKWSSVYRQFWRWTLSGLWELLLEALNESGGGNPSLQMIDSTIIRAHHCSARAKDPMMRSGQRPEGDQSRFATNLSERICHVSRINLAACRHLG